MGTVFVDMLMSLDGFVAGPNNDDSGLHDWYFAPSGHAIGVIDELMQTIGAMIIGSAHLATSQRASTRPIRCRTSS